MEALQSDEQIRAAQVERIVGFLDRIDAFEFFESLRTNPDSAKDIEYSQFEDFVIRINGIARDIPIVDRHADGRDVHLSGFGSVSVPEHEDKVPLLKEAFEEVPHLRHKEDVAYMLPLIINAVHLFMDGNGRSSRIMHLLLRPDITRDIFIEELKKAVGINGRFDVYNISTEHILDDVEKIALMRRGLLFENENKEYDPIFPHELDGWASVEFPQSQEGRRFKKLIADDYVPCFVVAYNYLEEKGLLDQVIVKYGDQESGERILLSLIKMDEFFTPEDWEILVNSLYEIKKERVEIMIDSFVEPEKYMSLDGTKTIRDKLIEKIEKEYIDNNKEVSY